MIFSDKFDLFAGLLRGAEDNKIVKNLIVNKLQAIIIFSYSGIKHLIEYDKDSNNFFLTIHKVSGPVYNEDIDYDFLIKLIYK